VVGWAQNSQERPDIGPRSKDASYYIEGRVVDEHGAPVSMAQIVLTVFHTDVGTLTAFSDESGRFSFYNLKQGTYKVNVSGLGYIAVTEMVNLLSGPENIRLTLRRRDRSSNSLPAQSVSVAQLAVPARAREHYQKGIEELQRLKFEKSVEHFQAAIKEHAAFEAAHSALGVAYVQMHKTALAREAFEQALNLDEQSTAAQLGLGMVCNDEKHYAEAEKHLLKAQQLNATEWRVHYELGRAYYGLEQFEKAEQYLRRAHEVHSDSGNICLRLANALVLQNKYAEGLAEMEEFLKLAPNSPFAPQVREKAKLLKVELAKP